MGSFSWPSISRSSSSTSFFYAPYARPFPISFTTTGLRSVRVFIFPMFFRRLFFCSKLIKINRVMVVVVVCEEMTIEGEWCGERVRKRCAMRKGN